MTMLFQEIRQMAKAMDINTYQMKKVDMIRAIQDKEKNIPCFGTERVDFCAEGDCCWRPDCITFKGRRSGKPKS